MTERTTLLVKNLPKACTTEIFAELLDGEGFVGQFDFAYVPIDFSQQLAFGYAFVNFCTPADACKAMEHLNGSDCWAAPGQSLEVQWSDPHQGLPIQIARYQNSPVMHPSIPAGLKPMLFQNGVRKEFPKPTKNIKAPRSRRRGDGADE
jgi:RNA recognition motif-containing protein